MIGHRWRRVGRGYLAMAWLTGLVLAFGWAAPSRADLPIEGEPILYHTAAVHDPVAKLQERLDRGEVKLDRTESHGYLEAVLEQLGVPRSSQTLVFSKTSFQHSRISPRQPRALYFNDDTYVGWVQGGDMLEIATVDPKQGAVFYLLDQRPSDSPAFLRQTDTCLQCHQSSKTQDVPGLLVRSVYPDRAGLPVFRAGSFVTGHESPMEERWGGWYVTGTHGAQRHMGNVIVQDPANPERLDREAGANRKDLSGLVDTWPYLTGHSDIVALMVLEHQTQMHNFITLAGYQTRLATYYEAGINKALGRPADAMSDSTRRRIESAAEKLVRYLLFVDESPLTAAVEGTSGFAQEFASRGPRDRRGRSLRDLDLTHRLFKYPCSYLIDSEAFNALPAPAKDHVYHRLHQILTGKDQSPEFAHLSHDDRSAILEILRDTKHDLPAEWTETP